MLPLSRSLLLSILTYTHKEGNGHLARSGKKMQERCRREGKQGNHPTGPGNHKGFPLQTVG